MCKGLQRQQRFSDAAAQFRHVIDLLPDHGTAHTSLGTTLLALDREDEAEAEFQKVLGHHYVDAVTTLYPLSLLVIYDSFVHSGGILSFLRKKFPARLPSAGGDEKTWINSYVVARKEWLKGKGGLLAKTIYRMNTFLDAITKDNWGIDQPLLANGKVV